jgi:hypothetical protein
MTTNKANSVVIRQIRGCRYNRGGPCHIELHSILGGCIAGSHTVSAWKLGEQADIVCPTRANRKRRKLIPLMIRVRG